MKDKSLLARILSRRVIFGTSLGVALAFMLTGIVLWGGFNWAMEATNTMTFCTSCHEMADNVYAEYKGTPHDINPSGVGATCSDCHVPDPWHHKVVRKVYATRELWHKALGTVDTPEKFDERRLIMAERVWDSMKRTDSRECRNCHDWNSMNPEFQSPRARSQHKFAMEQGHTCIDCHMGLAHSDVHDRLSDEELEELTAPRPEHRQEVPESFLAGIARAEEREAEKEAARQAEAERERERRRLEEQRIKEAVDRALAERAVETDDAPEATDDIDFDWSGVPEREVTVFFPGQASMEWTLVGRMHGGARAFRFGDTCESCHGRETDEMGEKIVTGETAEEHPIPGKRGSMPVAVQAAHDSENLYLRFEWPMTDHVPVDFVDGGKMDPDNPIKVAVMLSTDKPEYAAQAGCWAACHHDLRDMPAHPDDPEASGLPLDFSRGVTKYLKESRTEVEEAGRRGATLGGWDKLEDEDVLADLLASGQFMDLMRINADGSTEHGHVLEERIMTGGAGFEASVSSSGGYWQVDMKRPLQSDQPGDVSLQPGETYNFSFAIHDDHADGRFHHVSLGYRMGLDDEEVDFNVVGR
ncbi:NapC/NirT family cytochrome c [Wenzhouxiangella sp. AB-CW3]|uniref:NapC/NirT family cytochrome c n=1 Tax=Wenzhouxiangella sp. AB-CW3 TaxID=2771012 RepID=UPI00168A871D|nr:NapC/NirT family cytochrome c [Wenzhouxiangella sp. AB-CW3]QOC21795.1 NapC/NirT family cytochrome c [Wenzhouxiangella sp. AB-CW3]